MLLCSLHHSLVSVGVLCGSLVILVLELSRMNSHLLVQLLRRFNWWFLVMSLVQSLVFGFGSM